MPTVPIVAWDGIAGVTATLCRLASSSCRGASKAREPRIQKHAPSKHLDSGPNAETVIGPRFARTRRRRHGMMGRACPQLVYGMHRDEQSWYWQRFLSFLTLNAGLLVLFSSDALARESATVIGGFLLIAIVLSVLWTYIQSWGGYIYVNRLREDYRSVRQAVLGKEVRSAPVLVTTVGAWIPPIVLLLWIWLFLKIVLRF